ncbi:hypothetical protein CHLNCDRAFT_138334 [Chlorella variabilis]|uniref:protein-tyrosine-phosphatase n=1 Tax=Chlorella variabilis TaxID=554065 RepID=E1ZMT5_CHLVA|nr:hypothetical protein CHLNCDRAFT_138334 [Chlorella variabilis]EFN52747.1 hypothetical protein CHLNCDRAFT_138334 [Chlorella variabilis]|eukprot:XP_005844849.1 hypothetical protein CHLNCDRAFT_138334 [Chlorella variabilis]
MPPPLAGEVAPGLFVGGLSSLDRVQELGITHVVTVLNDPGSVQHAALAPGGSIRRHLVDVEDAEEANLLQQLPAAVAFVAAARRPSPGAGPARGGGRVLVHCAQGVSRSAALAAACLMAAAPPPGLEPGAALAAVRRAAPAAAPNPGFVAQLELFYAMGCRLEESYVPYKRFLLQQAAQQYRQNGRLDAVALPQPQEGAAGGGGGGGGGGATMYRCRKCRTLVATAHNVVEVEQGPGAAGFRWRKRDKHQHQTLAGDGGGPAASSSTEDGSLFLEPLRWMCEAGAGGAAAAAADSVVGGAVQGKLYCPKCGARLGSFNWAGTQSSSGAWVTPAFQLHLSKLDAVEPRPAAAIRQPRVLGDGTQPRPAAAAAAGTPAAAAGAAAGAAGAAGAAPAAVQGVGEAAAQLQRACLAAGPQPPAAADAHAGGAAAAAAATVGASAGTPSGAADGTSGTTFFRYLVLDCDGVLVDSERASCEALRRAILAVTAFDIPHAFPADFQPVFGMDVRSCVEYYQRRFDKAEWGPAAEVAARVSAVKEGLYGELTAGGIRAFPGVERLVEQARALGMGVAVASSGSPEKIAHNLGSSGLACLFPDPHLVRSLWRLRLDGVGGAAAAAGCVWGRAPRGVAGGRSPVVSAKHVARGKPAPDVYVEALRRLGCTEPARALVVEDAVNGLLAAKAAGAFAAAVATSLPAHMLAPHADLVLEHLRELDLAAVAAAAEGAAGGEERRPQRGGEGEH